MTVCSEKRYIFASGTTDESVSDTVEQYDLRSLIKTNASWQRLPDLCTGRAYHASCCIGNSLYILCGRNRLGPLSSIERLHHLSDQTKWENINLQESFSIYGMQAAQVSRTEILLCGGFSLESTMNEMHVFDLHKQTMRKVAQENQHSIWPAYFPCCSIRNGRGTESSHSLTLVLTVDYSSKNVLEYDHGTQIVRVIAELPQDDPEDDDDSY